MSRNRKPAKIVVPKALLLIDEMESITAGGTERQILQIAQLLRQSNFYTAIATLRGTEWLTPEIAGCPVYRADVGSLVSKRSLMELRKLVQWIRQQKFHVMTTFFSESNCLGAVLARLAGTPLIIGARRNMGTDVPMQWRPFLRINNLFVDRFHANCDAVRQRVIHTESIEQDRIDVVYNGIDLSRFENIGQYRHSVRKQFSFAADAVVYGMVSGLRPEKGVRDFLEAARTTIKLAPRTRILIVGDGPERSKLEAFIEEHQMHPYVRFAGAQSDVRPYLAAMDVGVLSSYGEGLSNSLLEYMSAGLPVIATNVGGNKEAAGYAGILVPAKEPVALAGAMQKMQDETLRRMLSKRALNQARCFSLDQARLRLSALYLDLLRKKLPLEFLNHKNVDNCVSPLLETHTSRTTQSNLYSTAHNSHINRSTEIA